MWKLTILALVACVYGFSPSSRTILYDPATYEVLYDAAKGPYNETWRFSKNFTFVNLIVPSQRQIGGDDSTYEEHISVKMFRQEGGVYDYTEATIGSATFKGEVAYGTEMLIAPVGIKKGSNVTISDAGSTNSRYYIEITFHVPGLYPWHRRRNLRNICIVDTYNPEGYIIGLEYSLI